MALTVYILAALAAFLSLYLLKSKSRRPVPNPNALPSLLIPAYTSHARFLPIPSKHTFSYPLLYLGVDVDALETGSLDLPWRVIRYGGDPRTKLLGLRSNHYLSAGSESMRYKVEKLLKGHGIAGEEVGRVWLVTMPSYFGFEGINPLSVWYCYGYTEDESIGGLLCVILEVHNTFGEKHAYVLKMDSELRHEPKSDNDYAWTFPRSFHVSPFNSRDGYYRLEVIDPFSPKRPNTPPEVKVYLKLLTPEREAKLQALLASSPTRPATPIVSENAFLIACTVIFKYPWALLLTTPRILFQAYKLHYEKGLDVFPRPEPKVDGGEKEWNSPQEDLGRIGMGVGWQPVSGLEKSAAEIVMRWSQVRSEEIGVVLRVAFRDMREALGTTAETDGKDVLVITTSDPKVFQHLVSAPTPQHYLLIAPEDATTVSDPDLFQRFFTTLLPPSPLPSNRVGRSTNRLRLRHLRFFLSHSRIAPPPDLLLHSSAIHFLDTPRVPFWSQSTILRIVYMAYLADVIEEAIFYALGARFIEGREPWRIVERALARQYR